MSAVFTSIGFLFFVIYSVLKSPDLFDKIFNVPPGVAGVGAIPIVLVNLLFMPILIVLIYLAGALFLIISIKKNGLKNNKLAIISIVLIVIPILISAINFIDK